MPSSRPSKNEWWIDGEGEVTADELLDGLCDGRWSLSSRLRARPGGVERELRFWLREVVLSSYAEPPEEREEDVFRLAFERAQVGLAVSDVRGQLVLVNRAFAELLGYEEEELIGAWVSDISGPDPEGEERELASAAMAGRTDGYTVEKQLRHRDGTSIEVLVAVGIVRDKDGLPQKVAASVLDLRKRRAEQSRERAEESMRMMQLISRGVAHDVSNLLTAIRTTTEALQEELPGPEAAEDLETIMLASNALTRLVDQLKRLSSMGQRKPHRCDLAHELRSRHPLLERLLQPQHRLLLDVPDEPKMVTVDSVGLEQIILNLVVNASQAIGEKRGQVEVRLREKAEAMELDVVDDGAGMSEDVRRRALEPFFSTKRSGSGLGLAIVQAALVRSSATLEIKSTLGEGTTMRVRLPKAARIHRASLGEVGPQQPLDRAELAEPDSSRRLSTLASFRVLLVDDDPLIRRIFGRVLQRVVAETRVAVDGSDAFEMLDTGDFEPDIVITDFAMPNMNGIELATRLRRRWPHLGIILITAYDPPDLEVHLEAGLLQAAFTKPVQFKEVSDAILRALPMAPEQAASAERSMGR